MKYRTKKNNFLTNFILIFLVFTFCISAVNILFDGSSSGSTTSKDTTSKQPYCIYDSLLSFESAKGGLKIYLPTNVGYINYNIVHTVNESSNVDVWRLGQAFAYDDDLKTKYEITPAGAEWDMAVKIDGRGDFIGGSAHGDEIYTSMTILIDGKKVGISLIKKLTPFKEITIIEESIGYDPNDSVTPALKHYKEYSITASGVTLEQKVEWLNDYTLSSSYLAMMPPLASLTNMYYTDIDIVPKAANEAYLTGVKKAVVYTDYIHLAAKIKKARSVERDLKGSD